MKHRNAANTPEAVTLSANERIIRDCHSLYVDPEKGLSVIAENLGLQLLPPRKKIVVLLIGNHSAGKSSFINWYIEEHVQKTGVAIETQGFTLVTSGKKRESLTGNATLHLFPHFKPLQRIKGVVDFLTTEISTSRQKRFGLVTFIDTPGLVDGDMKYPFEVNDAILWLGKMADIVLVFFDPIGQALCKRTLNLVEALSNQNADKMKFYLSKADEAGHEADRQKVMMQIVQELCKRPGLNRCGFDMPAIYIPNPNKTVRCINQIEEVSKHIEKIIDHNVQNTLNVLERDCEQLGRVVAERIEQDNTAKSENFTVGWQRIGLCLIFISIPFLLLLNRIIRGPSKRLLETFVGSTATEFLAFFMHPIDVLSNVLPEPYGLLAATAMTAAAIAFLVTARWHSRFNPTLTRKQKRSLEDTLNYIENIVKPKKQQLYQEYLKQSVADYDF
ncbi:uncharacterized protein LOC135371048 [Ornithodoros turicata]|uniref:uncharacterized protein LOC135371048 n=1 Tax=Ornithodoros turicata TaxID=34597 RepID=UPI00313967D0